jgi:hypothetical protein
MGAAADCDDPICTGHCVTQQLPPTEDDYVCSGQCENGCLGTDTITLTWAFCGQKQAQVACVTPSEPVACGPGT